MNAIPVSVWSVLLAACLGAAVSAACLAVLLCRAARGLDRDLAVEPSGYSPTASQPGSPPTSNTAVVTPAIDPRRI